MLPRWSAGNSRTGSIDGGPTSSSQRPPTASPAASRRATGGAEEVVSLPALSRQLVHAKLAEATLQRKLRCAPLPPLGISWDTQ